MGTYQFTIVTEHHHTLKNVALILSGAAAAAMCAAYLRRRSQRRASPASASLSDAAVGAAVLETRAAIDALLANQYGRPEEVLKELFECSVSSYSEQVGILTERHCAALQDFTGERGEAVALELGCGVGAIAFELARSFPHVLAVDASKACINAAKTMKERGWMRYTATVEGELTQERTASVPEDIERERVNFIAADLSALPTALTGPFDAVVAANVLCRLPEPAVLLRRLPALVRPGGVAVLATTCDWQEGCTPREHWLGGYKDKQGKEVRTMEGLHEVLGEDFELVAEKDLAVVARHNARRYRLGVSHATVWKRR